MSECCYQSINFNEIINSKVGVLGTWNKPQGLTTEADKGSQNIYKIRKNVLKSEKIFQIVMFFGEIIVELVYEIWKTITYLNKIIESTNIIL